jgi:CIC family chloride channel protein
VTVPPLPSFAKLSEFRLRENQLFIALTIVIGILAGLAATLFALAIERTSRVLFGIDPSAARLFLVPALFSVVTGVLLSFAFKGVRGSGVPQTKASYHLKSGAIPGQVPVGKFLMGVLCIGSGHSLGREGPSVQIGAGIASAVGRWLRLPPARVKDLVPVGAAGALSAAFNTPVAAVIFALEELIGDMNAALLGSTVVASVASVVVARSLLGNEPLFSVPGYELVHPAEIGAYALLGVVGGVVSLGFCKGLLALRAWFARLPARTRPLQPAMGGVVVGAILIVMPQVMGVGYEYVDQALNGGMVIQTMLIFGAVKLLATIVSYSSGNAGGIFAPSLFMGAMLGGAVGMLVNQFAPFPTGAPGAYALVGMGTLFAGIIRAPMTSVFMIFEITQDYQIFVPLMVANMLSYTISRRYQPVAIYNALLQQDDVHLPSAAMLAGRRGRTARDVMTAEFTVVPGVQSIAEVRRALAAGQRSVLVGSREALLGVVGPARLVEAMTAGRADQPVSTLVGDDILHVHPDHPIEVVLERLAQSEGLLPVVSRERGSRVEGVITLDQVMRRVAPAPDAPSETPVRGM